MKFIPVSTLIVSIVIFLYSCSMVAPEHPESTGQVNHHTLFSKFVNDSYVISVRVPPNFDSSSTRHYPVIFQLDVKLNILDQFNVTTGYVSEMEKSGEISPTIVVGIGYPSKVGSENGRLRDYTIPMENKPFPEGAKGGSPSFDNFIKSELIPFIDKNYPIAGPEGRALFGHSLGGLFSAYSFLQSDTTPPIGAFIAASPSLWFDGGSIYKYFDSLCTRQTKLPCILYMTIGDLEGPSMVVYFDDFTSKLKSKNFSGLRFSAVKNNTDHLGNVSPSFSDGLKYLVSQGFGGAQ